MRGFSRQSSQMFGSIAPPPPHTGTELTSPLLGRYNASWGTDRKTDPLQKDFDSES